MSTRTLCVAVSIALALLLTRPAMAGEAWYLVTLDGTAAGAASEPCSCIASKRGRCGNSAGSAARIVACIAVSITPGATDAMRVREGASSATVRAKCAQNLYVAARKNTIRFGRNVVFDVDSTVPSEALIVIVDSDFNGM